MIGLLQEVCKAQYYASLSCTVTLSSISLYSDNSFVMVTWTGPVSLPDRIFSVQSSIIDTRTISSISINSAGIYTCSANVFYNGTNMYVLNATSATDIYCYYKSYLEVSYIYNDYIYLSVCHQISMYNIIHLQFRHL